MHIPSIVPGRRFALPRPPGSADALLIARHAEAQSAQKRICVVVTAEPADTQRLEGELAFFAPGLRIAVFPDWETLPYDTFSPHQDLISERLATLWRIRQREVDLVLLPASTALVRLAPPSFLAAYTFHFTQGARLDEAGLKSQLTLAGYSHVSQVVSPGEYAVRGSLIDLFPMGSPQPYRVDLFGDEVDSIRTFDPDTQRSLYPVPEVRLLPGREFPMDDAARTAFRSRWREQIEGDPTKVRLYKDIASGIATAGIEYYLPLFFDETATIFDYLAPDAALVLTGEVDQALQRFWADTRERHRFLQHDRERPILPPEALFLGIDEFFARTATHATLALRERAATDWARPLPELGVDRGGAEPLQRLQAHLKSTQNRVLIAAETDGRRESLLELLRDSRIEPPSVASLAEFLAGSEHFAIAVAPLAEGFFWTEPEGSIAVEFVTETELFATAPSARRRRKQEPASDVNALIRDLSELKPGDPVVHINHGIGRYVGLRHIDLGDGNSEFLHLEYADKATLYVPVAQLHLIGRYTGVSADEAPLHRLGSPQWDKAKRRAAEQVRDTAAELLNLYARRAAREGYAFRFAPHDYEAFATSFGFEETPDQQAAIHAVIQDMVSPRPMDRLICGDVGFGKTEVALRAAFVAVTGGKQVAILAPTTLLAEQHFQNISDRFGKWPVKVAELSRFRSPKEVKAAIAGHRGRHRRHRRRHAQAAVGERQVQAPRPARHRRGAPLRRAPQGGDEGAACRGRRADADRDADPAHARHGARGPARPVGDRHRAAAAAGDQDLRAQRGERNDPRGGAARAEARRAGLLPAQRGRDHRPPPRQAAGAAARGAHRHRPRPDARARARARDARLRRPAAQRAALLDDHRDRHRRADRQHHRHRPRRQVRPGAAAPAARPGRPFAPPGLCVPAGARHRGPVEAGGAAARRDPADGGARLGLLPGDARPRDPRRRRGAGREPERQHARGRLPALQRDARRGGALAQGGP